MKHLLTGLCVVALGLGLGACDQREERQSRAGQLLDSVVAQLEASETAHLSDLERAATKDRALAGRLSPTAQAQIAAQRKQFAVGSIIAKPRSVEEMQRIARAQEPNLRAVRPPTPQRSVTRRAPSPSAPSSEPSTPSDEKEGIQAAPPPAVFEQNNPLLEDLNPGNVEPRIMEAMITAEASMYEQMDRLGLEGTVSSSSSSGMMVMDLFAEASQFTGDEPGPFLADDAVLECPETLEGDAMKDDKVLATSCMVEVLQASGRYEYVEKDYIFEHQFARRPVDTGPLLVTPDDPLWVLQWHFRNNGEEDGESAGGAGFVDFWTRQGTTGSANVNVAVVDTGLALSHPDIANSTNVAPGWDMVSDPAMGNDGDGRDSDPDDPGDMCNPNAPGARDSFHGTHVAGTIGAAATNNSSGVAGGAWNVTIVPVRALGKCGGRLSDINDAIRWAGGIMPVENVLGELVFNENPADIINLSVGLFQICPASMQDAIDSVVERGAIVVAAAGNARLATEFYSPGGCNNVITVAAGDARGYIAPYSNFGPEVDVLAPGGDLDRDDNDDGHPDGVLSTRPATECHDPVTDEPVANCYYAYEQGTSMAAPHVSAALALIAAKNPDFKAPELEATLLETLMPRDDGQCTTSCELYAGATPIPDQPGICARPCGGLLNLENLTD